MNYMIAPGVFEREKTIESIQKNISEFYNVPLELMNSETRRREIVQVRQIAMFFAKGETGKSLESIGNKIGGKDHGTVLHAIKTVKNLIETDKKFKNQIIEIQKKYGFYLCKL